MAQTKRVNGRLRKKKPVLAKKSDAPVAAPVAPGTASTKISEKPSKKPAVAKASSKKRLPPAWHIARSAWKTIWRNKGLFFGIAAIYAVLNLLLVRGFSGATDLSPLKELLGGTYAGGVDHLFTGLTLFGLLVTSSGTDINEAASAYQTILVVITSLALVWTLRQVMAGERNLRIRDGFYKGMYPLIPVMLVVVVIILQLLPLAIGGFIYALVIQNGIAVNALERVLWSTVFIAGIAASLYMVVSSVFAAYIAALPDMTPLRALRSASGLVWYRRWTILRKLLFLPLLLLIIAALIMVPVILTITPAAPWIFFLLSMFSLVLIHAYMYTLYRELLP